MYHTLRIRALKDCIRYHSFIKKLLEYLVKIEGSMHIITEKERIGKINPVDILYTKSLIKDLLVFIVDTAYKVLPLKDAEELKKKVDSFIEEKEKETRYDVSNIYSYYSEVVKPIENAFIQGMEGFQGNVILGVVSSFSKLFIKITPKEERKKVF